MTSYRYNMYDPDNVEADSWPDCLPYEKLDNLRGRPCLWALTVRGKSQSFFRDVDTFFFNRKLGKNQ